MAKAKNVGKGLTTEQAKKKHPYNKSMGDCRGFCYDKKKGKAEYK